MYGGLPHALLITKLEAYDFDMTSFSLLKMYVTNLKQRAKLGSSYSDYFEFIREIPKALY